MPSASTLRVWLAAGRAGRAARVARSGRRSSDVGATAAGGTGTTTSVGRVAADHRNCRRLRIHDPLRDGRRVRVCAPDRPALRSPDRAGQHDGGRQRERDRRPPRAEPPEARAPLDHRVIRSCRSRRRRRRRCDLSGRFVRPNRRRDLVHRRRALPRLFRQHPRQQLRQPRRNRHAAARQRRSRIEPVRGEQLLDRVPDERRQAGEHLEQEASRARRCRPGDRAPRCPRTARATCTRASRASSLRIVSWVGPRRGASSFATPKSSTLTATAAAIPRIVDQEDVLRLEVAVDDPLVVRRAERVGDLPARCAHASPPSAAAPPARAARPASRPRAAPSRCTRGRSRRRRSRRRRRFPGGG